jgi:RNA polymerase II elongation factor ELL
MATLPVSDTGLVLESTASSGSALPVQAFGLTLSDSLIEDMIRCVQDGDEIELTLGSKPCFHFGSRVHEVNPTPDDFDYDLYLTNPDESTSKAQRLPNAAMSIWKKPPNFPTGNKYQPRKTTTGGRQMGRSSSSEADTRPRKTNGFSQDSKQKAKPAKSSGLLSTGRTAMATALSGNASRSLPPSPSLNSAPSPNPAISASQQLLEKNKEQRSILVHELAAKDRAYEHLQDKWLGATTDLNPTLEKVASYDATSEKWSLKKLYWKELDVWNYTYGDPQDRQAAIENATRQYDKQRLGTTSPEWERLLAPEERGKGIILSKLQATLAKQGNITPAPKISVQKAEDGAKSDVDSSKAKSTPMSRSSSHTGPAKTKKTIEPVKRPLSSNTKKPLPPKKPVNKVKASDDRDKRGPLSEEFVYDSDSSNDQVPLSTSSAVTKPKLVEKPAGRPVAEKLAVEKPGEKSVEKPIVKPKASPMPSAVAPKPKPIVRAPRPSAKPKAPVVPKRAREDDDSSSSSGAPLSKRLKPKESQKPPSLPIAGKHRTSDVSQTSRSTANGSQASGFSAKSKATSPAKSSPLASSPPTNASDLEEQQAHSQTRQPQHRNGDRGNPVTNGTSEAPGYKKRKEREAEHHSQRASSNKKLRLSREILERASRFTYFYERYETLHKEIVALGEPPQDKLALLIRMRDRLVTMKSEISRDVAASA